ncbi:thio:disulfide interchange protein, putative [Parvularcula bermudensis HTCC2503]|uniref:Thio:disulfide interchange protein, putative n=1 Tax=Parvularcula bermudensis (strain ATCC BAA-594 / HTCC2503 / KCTC 12087) TaxID=314260 RepID=E0TDI0_PARBH|nr:thioredoxin family protein [Parvularcula bermudensis]ADM08735.1 thio:disulfide interchange protein, putative [Parvularcula bermudensis HTCC2503]
MFTLHLSALFPLVPVLILRRLLGAVGLIFLWAGLASGALAQSSETVRSGHAASRLVAGQTAGVPGETMTLALIQDLDAHWHVYWRNPGDSGLPLRLTWQVPDGFVAGEPAYPLPQRLPVPPLVNYGHEGRVVFLIPFRIPEAAIPGTTVDITVKADFLICKIQCVPETATLTLPLPIAAMSTGGVEAAVTIERARRALPQPAPFDAAYYDGDRGPVLVMEGAPMGQATFFPYAPSLIEPAGEVYRASRNGRDYYGFEAGFAYRARLPESLSGVVVIEGENGRRGYRISATQLAPPEDPPRLTPPHTTLSEGGQAGDTSDQMVSAAPSLADAPGRPSLLAGMVLGLLGGVVLNLMPCVFPIVFLKALGFAALSREERPTIRRHGLLYTAGVLTTFGGLAALLFGLRAAGEGLGWGFHLQSPLAVGIFAVILFLVALNLLGVYEMGTSVQGTGDQLTKKPGAAGAFFTGVLAVAVAAPCIGPFLGGATGLALAADPVIGLVIFLSIGLGLALPYLGLSFVPKAVRVLPRPGPWMVILRQLFSFALFAALVWLIWLLSVQTGPTGVLLLGLALLASGLAAYLFGLSQSQTHAGSRWRALAAFSALLAVVPLARIPAVSAAPASGGAETMTAIPWSPDTVAGLIAEGRPVFVDFTAAWCITCQVNKLTVLDTARVKSAFAAANVAYVVADWTRADPQITAELERLGLGGIPVYLYYDQRGESRMLPQILSVDLVVATVAAPGT